MPSERTRRTYQLHVDSAGSCLSGSVQVWDEAADHVLTLVVPSGPGHRYPHEMLEHLAGCVPFQLRLPFDSDAASGVPWQPRACKG